ncbi:NRDE family protein [Halospeciosus flavus]|uniref:NRDE family protein n=1 Tax=Halospeciosus flavus TaxID=3032283 RepID=A0ABD5Z2K4_9EURY|nr:NRDE family protein [Halospeciosus flavus]
MCTLAFAWHAFDDAPLLVAANRDESLGRPSEPPVEREWGRRVLAPKDREAGGTWMGINDAGLFVGVTNLWTDVDGGGERSRGLLVRDALGAADAREARALVREAVDADRYNGFYLVLADARGGTGVDSDSDADAFCCWWDGALHETSFDPGVHVVANEGFDDGDEKSRWVRDALRDCESPEAWRSRARETLRNHEHEVCVHGDDYGTRSSTLLTVDDAGEATVEFADGPPCETTYGDPLSFS